MKKTERKSGLSPNQERLQGILEYRGYRVITRVELLKLIEEQHLSKNPHYLIKSMLLNGRLVSFKRGNYIIVPIKAIDKSARSNEFEIITYILKNQEYYIGLFNAFNLHGFTEQMPSKMFIFNTKYSADKEILHFKFKFFKIKKDKLFGIFTDKYPYSDKERTIIDVLEYPQYLGGLSDVLDRIRDSTYDKQKVVDYAIKYNSVKVMKLVGILTDNLELNKLLFKKGNLKYYTTIRKSGTKLLDKKWKIRLI